MSNKIFVNYSNTLLYIIMHNSSYVHGCYHQPTTALRKYSKKKKRNEKRKQCFAVSSCSGNSSCSKRSGHILCTAIFSFILFIDKFHYFSTFARLHQENIYYSKYVQLHKKILLQGVPFIHFKLCYVIFFEVQHHVDDVATSSILIFFGVSCCLFFLPSIIWISVFI